MRHWLRQYGWKFALALLVVTVLLVLLVNLERRASGEPPLTGVGLVIPATGAARTTTIASASAGAPTSVRVTPHPGRARESAPAAAPSS